MIVEVRHYAKFYLYRNHLFLKILKIPISAFAHRRISLCSMSSCTQYEINLYSESNSRINGQA